MKKIKMKLQEFGRRYFEEVTTEANEFMDLENVPLISCSERCQSGDHTTYYRSHRPEEGRLQPFHFHGTLSRH